jgi:hypothetical protein
VAASRQAEWQHELPLGAINRPLNWEFGVRYLHRSGPSWFSEIDFVLVCGSVS